MPTITTLLDLSSHGSQPDVVVNAAGDVIGTTANGGTDNQGTAFEIPPVDGSYVDTATTLFSFNGDVGSDPTDNLIVDPAGDVIGVTESGTLFEIPDVDGSYAAAPTELLASNDVDYDVPLTIDAAGDVFGVAPVAETTVSPGSVFELPYVDGSYASTPVTVASLGGIKLQGLTLDAAGDIFGTTEEGGAYGYGGVYEIAKTDGSYASTPTTLASFDSPATAEYPNAALLVDAVGDLFGTTRENGFTSYGAVYEIAKTNGVYSDTPIILASYSFSTDVFGLGTSLIADAAGDLFGTTGGGGAYGDGTVFEIPDVDGTYSSTPVTVFSFDGIIPNPDTSLVANASGDLFGISQGVDGSGTVFELSGIGFQVPTLTTLVNFTASPAAGLVLDASGDLFGTTSGGGTNSEGTVFEIANSDGSYADTAATLASFNGTDGYDPVSALTIDAEGDLYGTTELGGAPGDGIGESSGDGTVFELSDTDGSYASSPATLAAFDGTDGALPETGMVADASGDLFGTTSSSGPNDATVFEIAKSGGSYASTPITLASFAGANTPGLTIDAAGDLFGTTQSGGTNGDGTVFEIPYTDGTYAATPVTLASFDGTLAENPTAGLLVDASGNLFGTTPTDGSNDDGTVFEITNTDGAYASTPTILATFDGTDGSDPNAGLIADAAGDLFGTTAGGGADGDGTVFEIAHINGAYASAPTTVFSFDGADGQDPNGGLTVNAAGDLFGTTSLGGANGDGTAFELNDPGFRASVPDTTASEDFSGDGMSDIVFQNTNGNVMEWLMNGSTVTSSPIVADVEDPGWSIAGFGDFTGGANTDMLWQNSGDGTVVEWQMAGGTIGSSATVADIAPGSGWSVAGIGDFTGNGMDDILWQNTNGVVDEWQMNGSTIASSAVIADVAPGSGWSIAGIGDFTGNGMSDILWQNTNGALVEWQMNGDTIASSATVAYVPPGSGWSIAGIGDFTGNGMDDILWQNTNGTVDEWQMNGNTIASSQTLAVVPPGSGWSIAGTGDYTGNGTSDILWQNTNGFMVAWLMNGGTVASTPTISTSGPGSGWSIAESPASLTVHG